MMVGFLAGPVELWKSQKPNIIMMQSQNISLFKNNRALVCSKPGFFFPVAGTMASLKSQILRYDSISRIIVCPTSGFYLEGIFFLIVLLSLRY